MSSAVRAGEKISTKFFEQDFGEILGAGGEG